MALLSGRDNPPRLRGTLAFSAPGFANILTVRAGSVRPRRVTIRRGPEFDPSFSPDGRRIAYRDSRRGINRDDEIWIADVDGRNAHPLTRNSANDWSPAWSHDGRTIAFASTRSGPLRLWLMNADGSRPRRLSQSAGEYPTWSPDGARLAFSMLGAGAVQVGMIGRDGRRRTVAGSPSPDASISWSSNPTATACGTSGPRGHCRIGPSPNSSTNWLGWTWETRRAGAGGCRKGILPRDDH